MDTVVTAMTSGLQSIAADTLSGIGSIVPIALPIMGAVVVITVGIRLFKKVGK